MYHRILLILFFLTGFYRESEAQAPANDDCANATAITLAPFGATCSASISASTANATASTPGTTCLASPDDDTWYSFTATSSSIIFRYSNAVNAATGNQTSPSFAIYQSACPATTTTFFCSAVNVSGGGFRIVNGLTIGNTYYLRLWSLSTGIAMTIDFCVQAVPAAPSNDDCANAQAITPLAPGSTCTSPINASTIGATPSTPAPNCSSTSSNDDIWYSFTASTSAINIQFSNARHATTNTNANLGYAMYSASCPTTTATLVCNGNLGAVSGAVTIGNLTPGTTYYIRFFSLGDNNYMTFDFCVIDVVTAANDECVAAVPIQTYTLGSAFVATHASTANATHSTPDPSCTSTENNDDIWYRFTAASASIVLNLKNAVNNETGSGGTVGFALYQGACPTTTTTVACNPIASAGGGEIIINGLVPGQPYFLRFWSTLTGGQTVSFDFYVQDAPAAPNDECVNAIPFTLQPATGCTSMQHASTAGATRSSPDPSCSGGYNDDDIWYSFVAAGDAVRINFSNANGLAGSSSNTLGFSLQGGTCASPGATLGCEANFGTNSGTALVNGLTAGQTYYIRFFSYDVNNYIEFDFCVVDADLPDNDECVNAINIPVGNGFCTSPVIGGLSNATTSPGFSTPSCVSVVSTADVWFRVIIPASGNVVIQTSVVANSSIEDLVMEAYSGICGSLSLIACDDNGNPDPSPSSSHSRISLTGRTPGETVYLRVLKRFATDYNQFGICAWDSTVVLPVAAGGNCVPGNVISISSANGNRYMWIPIFDAGGNIIAELNARGNELGNITSSLFVNTSGTVRSVNGSFYLDRNVTITPQANGGARIRLYFKDTEYQALVAAGGNISSLRDLKVNRTNEACENIFRGNAQLHIQDTSGNYGSDHFIECTIGSFSSFFIDGNVEALPLAFLSVDAAQNGADIIINWSVVQDPGIAKFIIQRSNDGNSFVDIGEHDPGAFLSAPNNSWRYTFRDRSPGTGIRFYRVIMKGENGSAIYSKVVAIDAGALNNGLLRVYPNPVSRYLVVELPASMPKTELTLFNSSGVLIRRVLPTSNPNRVYTLDLQDQPSGLYFLNMAAGKTVHQFKVVKL